MNGIAGSIIIGTVGGLGLFLLGMILMTEGLRALAGDAVRAKLMRFTRTPLSGAMTGAACTALLQSSSATTVAAVGFVGAGLMSFTNALGIIFGANIGTTITGWLVALIGFKLELGTVALPLVFAGALMRLFGAGRISNTGLGLAGFALIFIGIAAMQDGMRGLESAVNFAGLPAGTFVGRIELIGIGILFTLVTQSSSAAVAATLTALNAGLVDLPQAGCLVIGADIGTTVTAGLATIGASLDARRTGLSHVIYNAMTGLLAFVLVIPYVTLVDSVFPRLAAENGEVALVIFHSGFNVLGVLLVLPFARQFARLVETLVPQRDSPRMGLDSSLLAEPPLALNAVQQQVEHAFTELLAQVDALLGDERGADRSALAELQRRLDDAHDYVVRVDLRETQGGEWDRLLALLQALDHLQRLHERCEEDHVRAATLRNLPALALERDAFIASNRAVLDALAAGRWDAARQASETVSSTIEARVDPYRNEITVEMAQRRLSVEAGTARLEAVRWLQRVSHHIARTSAYLESAAHAAGR